MDWQAPPKPAEVAESRLITAILTGHFPIGTTLPAERELAGQLGVTRPTLREALQRLGRDGWVEIHHGKPTRIRNYWQEGSLGVLGSIARFPEQAPDDFVPNLLEIRTLMAPAYTRQAAAQEGPEVINMLQGLCEVEDQPLIFANADWQMHHRLTILSGNPIFTLILNGFENLYCSMARIYFNIKPSRAHSRRFYQALLEAVQLQDLDRVERLTQETMVESLEFWELAIRQADVDDVNNGWRG